MGKPTGFMDWEREGAKKRSVEERKGDFREFILPLAPEATTKQAGRCMDCGVPFCHQGCPLGNVIPDFNEHVFRGRWRQAWEVLARTNEFPEFTGRLCPAPCEAACVLAIDREAVTIEQMEKEIIERAFAQGWVQPRTVLHRTGRRVVVVGSGPTGLAAASRLNRLGHTVEVLERDDRLGGLLRYGIPDFKLEKSIIDRRIAVLEAEGILFRTGVDVGRSPNWSDLRASFDAVVVAIGARRPRALQVPGADAAGVVQAMDYLEAQNRAVALGQGSTMSAAGKRVVILGGGDTGSDCLGTALRQGAASVAQVELLPEPPKQRAANNPWPTWPVIFRTSSSQEEGGVRGFGKRTTEVEVADGRVAALHWVGVKLGDGKLQEVVGTEERVEVDLLIQAMGFLGPDLTALREQLGVELNARGNLKVDEEFRTSVPGVFGGGDASRGASLIVWAIADGRDLAKSVFTALAPQRSG
ncbi:MAG: glutamate synthase subunit beta [Myxococcales bacterium]|nr:glutamate synthase subunit beta [Myxococcales bacterium]